MTKGISIGVGADTRQFSQAVSRGVVEPLEDVSTALDDLQRDSDKAGDKLTDSAKSAGKALDALARDGDRAGDKLADSFKDAQRQTDKLGDENKKLSDVIERESAKGGRALKQNTAEATSAARRDLEELGNEARQNASETFSSFDGSAESFADGIQGTLGGIVSSLGPIGAAAGAAGALGIGLIMGAIAQADEDTQAYKERVAELAQEFIDTGTTGEASIDYLVDKLKELATETDSVGLKELARVASEAGGDFRDLAQAYAGNTEGLKDLWRAADARLAQSQQEIRAAEQSGRYSALELKAMQDKIDAQQKYQGYLGQALDVTRQATEQERLYAEAGGPELAAKAQSLDDYASKVQDALTESGEAWEQYTHDGVVNLDEYNAAIEASAAAVEAYQANMVTASATLSEEALNYIRSLGPAAAPLLQAYVDAPLEQKQRTAQNWATLGKTAADSYTNDLKANIPGEVQGPTIKATGDFSDFEWKLAQFTRREYQVGVGVLLRPGSAVQ